MKSYAKILSLDFEMYNSMRYWSICWIGAVCSDKSLDEKSRLDIKVNPGTRHKLIGHELKFPFKYSDLKPLPKFDGCAKSLFDLMDEDTLVVGHAIDNDVKMLTTACDYYGIECPDFDYLDTNAVRSAIMGEYSQIGLKTLAASYGFEFEAHNPAEDAAATLYVLKRMLEEKGIGIDEAESLGIKVGKVRNGLTRRCELNCMSANARLHNDNYNAVFDAVMEACEEGVNRDGAMRGVKMTIDPKLRTSRDLYSLIKWATLEGARVLGEPRKADFTLSSELDFSNDRTMSLRMFVDRFGVPESVREKLDFFPNKVTDESGEIVSYMQYLKSKSKKPAVRGVRATYCFAREIERRYEFEELALKLFGMGARICFMPENRVTFVVDCKERLKDSSDHKVVMFNRIAPSRKVKLMTLDELKELLR
ncbi:MAG: hypothetical protein HFK09_06960 [Clostridia bacterium]|nr:hypothetical protein [Clostridia bacterium]